MPPTTSFDFGEILVGDWKKAGLVEKLPPIERRQVVQFIEALVERNEFKREKAS